MKRGIIFIFKISVFKNAIKKIFVLIQSILCNEYESLFHVIMLLFMDESGSQWRDGDEIARGAKG